MIVVAIGMVAFLGMASLVTDLGLRYYQKSELQNACDSAALAAVTYLPDKTRAKQVALEYMSVNGFDPSDVLVEFPEEYVVRVTKSFTIRTLFANVFNESSMQIQAHAAAKYVNKNLSIDFDYLMFYGDDSTFHVMGDFREVAGSIFGNGNVDIETNDAAVLYDVVSHRTVTKKNNMSYPTTLQSNAAYQEMPDWDEMIMSICPTSVETMFTAPHGHVSKTRTFVYNYPNDKNIYESFSNFRGGSFYCGGNLSTNYNSYSTLVINGDLYVEGNLNPSCPVYVTGNIYVGGNYSNQWGMSLRCGGNMYVSGNMILSGATVIGGELYTGGYLYIYNGNVTYNFKDLYVMGDFWSTNGWGAKITIDGNMFVYKSLALGGGGYNKITGNVYCWGHGYANDEQTLFLNGRLVLQGDVYNRRGNIAFGGNGDCTIIGFVYSGGGVETKSGGDISLNGCMIAEGDIKVGGASHTYNDSGATLSLYSRNGNIILGSQGSELNMWGIVYAPKGDIKIATDGLTIYGSLVANTITCSIGSGFYLGKNDRTLPFAKTVRAASLIE